MNVVGYDPVLSVDAALALPGDRMVRVTDLNDLFKVSDYISIHVPYIKGVTHHLIDAKALQICKPNVCSLNFARFEIVDGAALKACYDDDFALVEAGADPIGTDFENAGSAMGGFRGDAHLRPRHRHGSDAFVVESHCE